MAPTQLETVTQRLRELILAGRFAPGARIAETELAARVEASRTPVRLALQILEKEGLLTGAPRRGFAVREFTIDEVTDAIDVRGHLEGMAARLAAERGLAPDVDTLLAGRLDDADAIVALVVMGDEDRARWVEANRGFHAGVVAAAGNAVLAASIEHVARIPLAAPSAIVFDTADDAATRRQLAAALDDHRAILAALRAREGSRAEALMREHARTSRENKRRNIAEMKADRAANRLPGLDLVSAG